MDVFVFMIFKISKHYKNVNTNKIYANLVYICLETNQIYVKDKNKLGNYQPKLIKSILELQVPKMEKE